MTDSFRRRIIFCLSLSGWLQTVTVYGNDAPPSETKSLAGQWMDSALSTRASLSPLQVQRFADPIYVLLSPIIWRPSEFQRDLPEVSVPTGFVSDLASIPQIFWTALRPDAEYAYAAILHDYLYWAQTEPKTVADSIFRASMEDFQLSKAKVAVLYSAVSVFGAVAWERNIIAKEKGEQRIIKLFPNDPTTTWDQWKKQSGIF